MRNPSHLARGAALAAVLALLSLGLAAQPVMARLGLSALTLAIGGGMLAGPLLGPRALQAAHEGLVWAKGPVLRLGIVLYGLRLTWQDLATVGWAGALIDVLVLSSTFALAWWFGRRVLGLDARTVVLVGAGSSICGAAAVLATEPVVRAEAEQVTVAVASVVIFGTLAMFLYPALHLLLPAGGDGEFRYGVLTGSTVHEVAQVVVAARAVSEAAAHSAVITKMMRVMLLAPFLVWLSVWQPVRRGHPGAQATHGTPHGSESRARITVPWFAVAFVGMVGFNSLQILPAPAGQALQGLDNIVLARAMAALGLGTQVAVLRRAGRGPLVLAGVLFAWLLAGGSLINAAVMAWLG